MSSTFALQTRLKELSAALGQIHPLVNRLRNFTAAIGQGDEARLELGAEIHARLKEAEEEMELLKVEVEALETGVGSRRKGADSAEKDAERERVVGMAERLGEDLKRTRGEFRNAQLQAKRNAENAKRKERELLLSRPKDGESRKKLSEKLTHDDLVVNASSDVTAALRRTHQLMQAELSRSQFAQETLEQSTAALSSLSESYSNLDTLLSSSRTLVSSLLRSQKSDTWYLETAFYILIGTIIWLLFRRILYGPLWWLVWTPIKLIYKLTLTMMSAVGIPGAAVELSRLSTSSALSNNPTGATPTVFPGGPLVTGTDEYEELSPVAQSDSESMVEQIGKMAEESTKEQHPEVSKKEETNVDDISPEERERQEEMPRNPKKRMYEEGKKDEL